MEGTGWLSTHLNEFVQPRLGFIPPKVDFFTPEELTVIKNIWRSAKNQTRGLPMLLTGRDAFVFEILARREDYPTTFRPDISRATARLVTEDYTRHYLFDTGFAGSIARTLRIQHFGLASATQMISGKHQMFPKLKNARALALKIEATPKYWETAQYNSLNEIYQYYSSKEEFANAAGITIQVYTNSSSKFLAVQSPLGNTRRWQSFKKGFAL